ncbi:hypothetical protein EDC01DRAFT_732311 [Geopyxis carbonaria]|nr:hypothetical protein EDC01DRAFT_732311 [Geopyxis carbonaria]
MAKGRRTKWIPLNLSTLDEERPPSPEPEVTVETIATINIVEDSAAVGESSKQVSSPTTFVKYILTQVSAKVSLDNTIQQNLGTSSTVPAQNSAANSTQQDLGESSTIRVYKSAVQVYVPLRAPGGEMKLRWIPFSTVRQFSPLYKGSIPGPSYPVNSTTPNVITDAEAAANTLDVEIAEATAYMEVRSVFEDAEATEMAERIELLETYKAAGAKERDARAAVASANNLQPDGAYRKFELAIQSRWTTTEPAGNNLPFRQTEEAAKSPNIQSDVVQKRLLENAKEVQPAVSSALNPLVSGRESTSSPPQPTTSSFATRQVLNRSPSMVTTNHGSKEMKWNRAHPEPSEYEYPSEYSVARLPRGDVEARTVGVLTELANSERVTNPVTFQFGPLPVEVLRLLELSPVAFLRAGLRMALGLQTYAVPSPRTVAIARFTEVTLLGLRLRDRVVALLRALPEPDFELAYPVLVANIFMGPTYVVGPGGHQQAYALNSVRRVLHEAEEVFRTARDRWIRCIHSDADAAAAVGDLDRAIGQLKQALAKLATVPA